MKVLPDARPLTARERLVRLRVAGASPRRFAMARDVVSALDRFLSRQYGIDGPTTFDELDERLRRAAGTEAAAGHILDVLDVRNAAWDAAADMEEFDRRFFDAIAEPPVLGWVHSLKRAFILDAGVCLSWVCERLDIQGTALDVGCHAGYHAHWVASTTGISVTGVDLARRAVALARQRACAAGVPATYHEGDWRNLAQGGTFDLIYSVDGPIRLDRHDADVERLIRDLLAPGGVCLLIGHTDPDDLPQHLNVAAAYGLSCGMSDVVGGWLGDTFEGRSALVFVKTGNPVAPRDDVFEIGGAWDKGRFADYANDPSTPWREKTQAFHRSSSMHVVR